MRFFTYEAWADELVPHWQRTRVIKGISCWKHRKMPTGFHATVLIKKTEGRKEFAFQKFTVLSIIFNFHFTSFHSISHQPSQTITTNVERKHNTRVVKLVTKLITFATNDKASRLIDLNLSSNAYTNNAFYWFSTCRIIKLFNNNHPSKFRHQNQKTTWWT